MNQHPYCRYVATLQDVSDVDRLYHDHHYGVAIEDDNELFCRLVMEINQAGLSWRTILLKEKGLRDAYDNFDIQRVAAYGEKDVDRLMGDAKIIRNRLKIKAAVYNAQQLLLVQKEYGSFRAWLDSKSKEVGNNKVAWVKLFKQRYAFVGGEIVGEFLMSIGLIEGAHDAQCPRYQPVVK